MSLSDIKVAAFADTDMIHTEVRGWDVSVLKDHEGYHVTVALMIEPDESDKSVIVGESTEPSAICAKYFVKELLDDCPITAAAALKRGAKHDFGEISLDDLVTL